MSAQNLSILFRLVSLLFLVILGISIYNSFNKNGKKKYAIRFGFGAAICFITIVCLVFYSANSDYSLAALKANPDNESVAEMAANKIPQNVIYKDIGFVISIAVRIVIVGIISFMLYFLWKKSKTYPQNIGIKIHRALLLIGFLLIAIFVVYETKNCFIEPDYREVIPLGLYSAFFAGGMFWMLICSIVSAASLPEK